VAEQLHYDIAVEEGRVRRVETCYWLPSGVDQVMTLEDLGDVRPPEADIAKARDVLLTRRE